MLDSLEPREFDELLAFWNIAPWAVGFPVEKPEGGSSIQDSMAAARRMAGV